MGKKDILEKANVNSVFEREKYMNIYIYGTGSGAEKLYRHKIKKDIVISGFLDSNSSKWGNEVSFAPKFSIVGIKDIKEPYDAIIIASVHKEIYFSLLENNINPSKILVLSEYVNNDIQNINNRNRNSLIMNLLKAEYMDEFAKVENLFPQGNYSSSIVDIHYIEKNEGNIFKDDLREESGIELNLNNQLELLHLFSKEGNILPFSDKENEELRFYGDNDFFHTSSAHILSHIIKTYNTNKIIEAGSGYSSAVMLDVNEKVRNNKIQLTFIEPYPERLKSILKPEDNVDLRECKLQEVDLKFFKQLEKGDILFIDSSHVSKTGSDVNYIIFEILPVLNPGVIIHFHDVFYPFEYPKEWVYEGRGWTENYILRAFLQYNEQFEILFWEDSLCKAESKQKIQLTDYDNRKLLEGGSLYIRKTEGSSYEDMFCNT